MNPEKPEGSMPPEEQFDEDGNEIKPLEAERSREEMQGELREHIEMREFPNRMKGMKFRKALDIDGNPIPPDQTLFMIPVNQ